MGSRAAGLAGVIRWRTTRLVGMKSLQFRLAEVIEWGALCDGVGGYVTCPSSVLRREKPLLWSICPWYRLPCFSVSWGRVLIGRQVVNKDVLVAWTLHPPPPPLERCCLAQVCHENSSGTIGTSVLHLNRQQCCHDYNNYPLHHYIQTFLQLIL